MELKFDEKAIYATSRFELSGRAFYDAFVIIRESKTTTLIWFYNYGLTKLSEKL